jgi:hypothetical protein
VEHNTFSSEKFKGKYNTILTPIGFEDKVASRLKKMRMANQEISSLHHQMMHSYEGEK